MKAASFSQNLEQSRKAPWPISLCLFWEGPSVAAILGRYTLGNTKGPEREVTEMPSLERFLVDVIGFLDALEPWRGCTCAETAVKILRECTR